MTSNYHGAIPALAFVSLWGVGHTVTILAAGLRDVPCELYKASEINAAGVLGRIGHVTLPRLSPVIFLNLVVSIMGSLQVSAISYFITGGGPILAAYFLTMYRYDNAFRFLRMEYASAIGWALLLIVLALTVLSFWSSKRRMHYQGK